MTETGTADVLSLEGITVHYGGLRALDGVGLRIAPGELVCLIGSNGSGKTTTLRAVSGLVPVDDGGRIEFEGRDITNRRPFAIAELGIAHVPQGRELFGTLTVRENLSLGAYVLDRDRVERQMQEVFELFPVLERRVEQRASTLSGGEAQMLTIGRALMSDPKLLLMDEPSLGVAPKIVDRIYEAIAALHDQGRAILVVEQNPALALEVSDRAYVLQVGEVVLEGQSDEVGASSRIEALYLGGVAS